MIESPLISAVLDLLWSVWTELGATGVRRHHKHMAIDPEPLILFTPRLAASDPRLVEQAALWCGRHADYISKTRLQGLGKQVAVDVQQAFSRFADPLSASGVHWSNGQRTRTSQKLIRRATTPPPLERAALVRLRMRTLAGVGLRADVLCELLAEAVHAKWVSASRLRHLGYTKRSTARVLEDLVAANIAVSRPVANSLEFRLRDPNQLAGLIHGENLIWVHWSALLALAARLLQLEGHQSKPSGLRQVAANDAREELRVLALLAGFPEPPPTAGHASAFTDLVTWGAQILASLAQQSD